MIEEDARSSGESDGTAETRQSVTQMTGDSVDPQILLETSKQIYHGL